MNSSAHFPDPLAEGSLEDLTHTLRTPLNHIIGLSELLAERAGDEGHSSLQNPLGLIAAAGRKICALTTAPWVRKWEAGRGKQTSSLWAEAEPLTCEVVEISNRLLADPRIREMEAFDIDLTLIRAAAERFLLIARSSELVRDTTLGAR